LTSPGRDPLYGQKFRFGSAAGAPALCEKAVH